MKKARKTAPRTRTTNAEIRKEVEDPWSRTRFVGLMHPDVRRDQQLLERVLPDSFPESELGRLHLALETIAASFGIDPNSPNWLGETLFNLALEHPFLSIVERGRGRRKNDPRQVAQERAFLRFVFKEKQHIEATLGRKLSLHAMARKFAFAHSRIKDPRSGRSGLFPDGEAGDPVRAIYRRILSYKAKHPDLVPRDAV